MKKKINYFGDDIYMLHESEKFQFKVLLMGYLAIWLGLTLLPYVMDIGHWAGISRLWTHPMFSAFPALLWVVYGGSWIARWTDNEAWLSPPIRSTPCLMPGLRRS